MTSHENKESEAKSVYRIDCEEPMCHMTVEFGEDVVGSFIAELLKQGAKEVRITRANL